MVEGEDGDGNVKPGAAHGGGKVKAIHVSEVDVADDEVVARLGARQFKSLGGGGDVGDLGRVLEMQLDATGR